jgi:hypothetical protein
MASNQIPRSGWARLVPSAAMPRLAGVCFSRAFVDVYPLETFGGP